MNPQRSALGVAVAARIPVLLWGGPGVGKSSAVAEMAAAVPMSCETVIASIREPSDFAGLPVVATDGTVRFAAPSWAQRLVEAGRGVLFLDEISTAPPAVQAALLRVVLERTVGDLTLPDGVSIVAAANPPDQAADGWDLAAPLANRFCHLEWTLDARGWADGSLAGFDPVPVPTLDPTDLAERAATVRPAITAFVMSRPALLHAVPTEEAAAGRAWPSPRTWTMAITLLAAAETSGADKATTAALLSGAVGPGPAREFLAWRDDLTLQDPEAVLADPTSFVVPARGDRAWAAFAALTGAVVANNTPARWSSAWTAIAAGIRSGHADITAAAIRTLVKNRPVGGMPPAAVLREITPLLREAGLLDRLTLTPDR